MLTAQVAEVDLDPDLEQQEHDTQLGHELELVAVRLVAGRERGDREAGGEIADHRRQPELARDPPEPGGEQEREADIEDEVGRLHGRRITGGPDPAARGGVAAANQ